MIAEPLGLFDCCGVSDGAACAIVTTPEIARALGKKDLVTIKALQLSLSRTVCEVSTIRLGRQLRAATRASPRRRRTKKPASRNPREEISMMEVHDCFSITELVTMEDLFISSDGGAVKDVMDGFYDADGKRAVPDRRRPEVLRPSDRGVGSAHGL